MRELLDQQAEAIEQVLHGHNLMVNIVGGTLSPRLVHFHLSLPPNVRLAHLTPLLPAIAQHTGAQAIRLAQDANSGSPTLEIPRQDPVPVRLLSLARQIVNAVPDCAATLGLDTSGSPLLLRVDGPEVGAILLSGAARSGKSELLKSIALSLALHNGPSELRLLLIDLNGASKRGQRWGTWSGFEAAPHTVGEPVITLAEARNRLRWAARLISNRADLRDEGTPIDGPSMVVLVDGLESVSGRHHDAEIEHLLRRIASEGNGLGVHMVGASRSARGLENVPWGARIVGRSENRDEARAASGINGSGAEGLLDAGDFLAILGGHVVRFQAATMTRDELDRTIATMRAASSSARAANSVAQPAPTRAASRFGWLRTGTNG